MPHIFLEPLEQRKSTQSLYTGFFPQSSYGYNPIGSYYGGDTQVYCYAMGPLPKTDYPNPWSTDWYNPSPFPWYDPWQIMWNPWTSPLNNPWSTPWNSPWNSPWSNPWSTPWNSPWSNPWSNPWNSPWSSPWNNPWSTPNPGTPTCYLVGAPLYSSSGYKEKFKQMRETLVAFFQEKGIFTEDHKQKLLSSPLDKA